MNAAVIDGVIIGTVVAQVSSLASSLGRSSRRPNSQPVLVETLRTLYALNVEANETRAQITAIRAARQRQS